MNAPGKAAFHMTGQKKEALARGVPLTENQAQGLAGSATAKSRSFATGRAPVRIVKVIKY
ncbi:MAG TPA: hypothetical protein PKV84_05450 [Candidatus Omnitrophota bacterium]|nr:hypothetical protein [Candidatus Omnitrophota bacterium]